MDLRSAVRAVEDSPDVGNPIKRAGQFRAFMAAGDPQIKALSLPYLGGWAYV
jgi:hypothetical protein